MESHEGLRDARMRWENTNPMHGGTCSTCGTCIMLGWREEEDHRRGPSTAYHRRTLSTNGGYKARYRLGRKGENALQGRKDDKLSQLVTQYSE